MNATLLKALAEITEEERALLEGKPVDLSAYGAEGIAVIDSEKMLAKGNLITIRPHTRFASFPCHSHNYIEIMYMCQGQTKHLIHGQIPVLLEAGDLLFLNPHATHQIDRADHMDIAINFLVLPEFFDTAFNMIGQNNVISRFLTSSLRKDGGDTSYLHFQVADILPIQNLIENLAFSLIQEHPRHSLINQTTMGLLLLQLLNHTDCLKESPSSPPFDGLTDALLREINENYRTISLNHFAQKHRVSPAYVSRRIHETTGCTYTELLKRKRLKRSVQLLLMSDLPVQDIIEAVGYDNSSYFYRIFKRQFQLSPRAYRKNMAEATDCPETKSP